MVDARISIPELTDVWFWYFLAAEGDRNLPPRSLGGCHFSEGARVSRGDGSLHIGDATPRPGDGTPSRSPFPSTHPRPLAILSRREQRALSHTAHLRSLRDGHWGGAQKGAMRRPSSLSDSSSCDHKITTTISPTGILDSSSLFPVVIGRTGISPAALLERAIR